MIVILMQKKLALLIPPRFFLKTTDLALVTITTCFFSRIAEYLGLPSLINFLHFGLISIAFLITFLKIQTSLAFNIFVGLVVLLLSVLVSALINDAGVINAVIQFLLLAEPFMLLLVSLCNPLSTDQVTNYRSYLTKIAFINLFFGLFQGLVLRPSNPDYVKGVFLGQSAGHVIGASISMTFAVYYLVAAKHKPLWLRILVLIGAFAHTILSDAKQVLLVFLLAFLILTLIKFNDVVKVFKYLTFAIGACIFLFWSADTIFPALKTWANLDIIVEGLHLKLSGFPIIVSHYHTPLNWLFGLGPGHTIGRLGGWMLREYADLLNPLGATRTLVGSAVWQVTGQSWLGNKSSMWSPLFGWAGIWGDIGFWGLLSYLYLWFLVWRKICFDDLSRYLVVTIIVFGAVFTQLEEPPYMLFISGLLVFYAFPYRN